MKGFSRLTLGLLAAVLIICPRASAQSFGLSVTPSANSIIVSNSLTYTITITNLTGLVLNNLQLTNSFSAPVQGISVATSPTANYLTNSASTEVVIAFTSPLDVNGIAQVALGIQPTTTGSLSNYVAVTVPGTAYFNSTNVVVQVTNVVIRADLGVTMTGPKQVVITNDWMTYGVNITNSGPGSAPSVLLTNTLPSGVLLKGISTNLTYTTAGSNMIFKLGTLTNGGGANLQFTVEPTNIATLMFSASVGSPEVTDTNTANNFASTNIIVTNYLSGPLAVATNSGQVYDPQNGLVEQFIAVTNNTNYAADAVRIIVTGLTNRLFNAVGTNNGNPFVYYSTSLPAGQHVGLLLQYSANAYFSITNGQLQAFAVPTPDWTPPPMTSTSTNINISRIVRLSNGNMLIEWPSVLGRTYTVVYSDNLQFTNAMIAPPSIVAPANRTQWIDYGPPATVSVPTNAIRFYRVYQNP